MNTFSSGNGNDLIINRATLVEGKFGKALSFGHMDSNSGGGTWKYQRDKTNKENNGDTDS
jgi:hypothetical protein